MKRCATAVLAALPLLLAGCGGLAFVDGITPESTYTREAGIAYGPAARQRLDIYRPKGGDDPNRPVLVFLYGGGWVNGTRGDYRFVGESLAEAGYTIVIPDYRLYPGSHFPAFVEDAAAATAWTARHLLPAGSPRRLVLIGHSAGGYLAAMLACDPHYLAQAGIGRALVAGWVGMAGPYDFTPTGENAAILAHDPGVETMPAKLCDAKTPPALLMLAGRDELVGRENAEAMAARLRVEGVPFDTRLYASLDHETLVGALASNLTVLGPVRRDLLAQLSRWR